MKNLLMCMCAASVSCAALADTEPENIELVDLTDAGGIAWSTSYPLSTDWYANANISGDYLDFAKAFDNGVTYGHNDRVLINQTAADICYTFDRPTLVNAYRIYVPTDDGISVSARAPGAWTFEASDDGTNWSVLDTRDVRNWVSRDVKYFAFENTTAHLHYRINITSVASTDNSGGYLQLSELEFFNTNVEEDEFDPSVFQREATLTIAGVPGGVALEKFPVLVRLSPETISGFDYSQFQREDHADLCFTDEAGNLLPHEIDTWNEEGESLVWVCVPNLVKDATFVMHYGASEAVNSRPANVWKQYAAVYHFNGSMKDSGRGGIAYSFVKDAQADSNGIVGAGFKNASANCGYPFSWLDSITTMTVSGWVKPSANSSNARIFSSKTEYTRNGFEFMFVGGTGLYARGDGSNSTWKYTPSPATDAYPTGVWSHYAVAIGPSSSDCSVYMNGAALTPAAGSAIAPITTHEGGAIYFGSNAKPDAPDPVSGLMDELRIYNGFASADWVKAEYDSVTDPDYITYGDAHLANADRPAFTQPTVTVSDVSYLFSVDVTSGDGDIYAVYTRGEEAVSNLLSTSSVDYPKTYTGVATGLAADSTYAFKAVGILGDAVSAYTGGTLYSGELAVAKVADAQEDGLVPGSFVITRADTVGNLNVNFAIGGTATEGTTYEPVARTATIPDGKESVTILITPKVDVGTTEDTTVTLTLEPGFYGVSEEAGEATLTIANLFADVEWNTWIATAPGKASDAANWSAGVPQATDKIMFDGRFSSADCEWDAGVNGLSPTVAAWRQTNGYAGTVSVDTEFDTYAGATFTCLTVSGDMTLESGTLTQPVGLYSEAAPLSTDAMRAQQHYRLRLDVKGDLTLSENAAINVQSKGYYRRGTGYNMPTAYGGSTGDRAGYGNPKKPVDLGFGACYGTDGREKCKPGGGAVYITVGGAFALNGDVNADGHNEYGYPGTAGGSVYIEAKSVTGTGKIHADSHYPGSDRTGGPGGRVAVVTVDPVDLSKLAITAHASYYPSGCGCGTVYLKDGTMTHGVLRVVGYSIAGQWDHRRTKPTAVTPVTDESDWTFDRVYVGGSARLSIPEGRTLTLPNGFVSVIGLDDQAYYSGIVVEKGGRIDAGSGDQTLSGCWLFCSSEPYAFDGNVTLKNGARIGIHMTDQQGTNFVYTADYTVAGDLTVESGSAVSVSQIYHTTGTSELFPLGAHGGWTLFDGQTRYGTYGSVFHPSLFGTTAGGDFFGAGAVRLTVGGTLTVNGDIAASSTENLNVWYWSSSASGGSIDITAGSIAGSGNIYAKGGYGKPDQAGGGGGGRIAIRLTDRDADFADSLHIGAFGHSYGTAEARNSSAGTVYLQKGCDGEGCGTIVIANDGGVDNLATTPIVATGYARDAVPAFKHTSLVVDGNAVAEVSADGLRMRNLTIASGSRLELAGRRFVVKSALVAGMKLASGTYTAAMLPEALTDGSDGSSGTLVVTGSGLGVIVR